MYSGKGFRADGTREFMPKDCSTTRWPTAEVNTHAWSNAFDTAAHHAMKYGDSLEA